MRLVVRRAGHRTFGPVEQQPLLIGHSPSEPFALSLGKRVGPIKRPLQQRQQQAQPEGDFRLSHGEGRGHNVL
ncbi:MAG: hypothetical protein ACR2GR_02955 [Rhodothermales bacterium]